MRPKLTTVSGAPCPSKSRWKGGETAISSLGLPELLSIRCENSSAGPREAVTSWHPDTPLRSVSTRYHVTQQTLSSIPSPVVSKTSGGASPNPFVARNDHNSVASLTSIPMYSAPSPVLPPSISVGMVTTISAPGVPSSSATTGPGSLM